MHYWKQKAVMFLCEVFVGELVNIGKIGMKKEDQ